MLAPRSSSFSRQARCFIWSNNQLTTTIGSSISKPQLLIYGPRYGFSIRIRIQVQIQGVKYLFLKKLFKPISNKSFTNTKVWQFSRNIRIKQNVKTFFDLDSTILIRVQIWPTAILAVTHLPALVPPKMSYAGLRIRIYIPILSWIQIQERKI